MNSLFLTKLSWQILRQQGRQVLSPTAWVALGGLILGVASLVVSMAVVSGFESTLRRSITEVSGDIQVMRLFSENEPWPELLKKVKAAEPRVIAGLPYLSAEAVLAHKGKLTGVSVQGIELSAMHQVLNFKNRVVAGELKLLDGEIPQVAIGQGIAKNHSIKVGEQFRVVVPLNSDLDPSQMKRKIVTLKAVAILDLGKSDYNERVIMAPIAVAQRAAEVGDRYLGLLLKTTNPDEVENMTAVLSAQLGRDYRIRGWHEVNENLFEAVKIEKVVIFFVILLIVIAAAVNVATSLYVNVVQKYSRIAILKALGLRPRQLMAVFCWQGLILGGLGSLLGLICGLALCGGFMWLEYQFAIIPGGVYRLDRIDVDLRFIDVAAIFLTTLFICVLAVFAPARQGVKLSITQGLRYE